MSEAPLHMNLVCYGIDLGDYKYRFIAQDAQNKSCVDDGAVQSLS